MTPFTVDECLEWAERIGKQDRVHADPARAILVLADEVKRLRAELSQETLEHDRATTETAKLRLELQQMKEAFDRAQDDILFLRIDRDAWKSKAEGQKDYSGKYFDLRTALCHILLCGNDSMSWRKDVERIAREALYGREES